MRAQFTWWEYLGMRKRRRSKGRGLQIKQGVKAESVTNFAGGETKRTTTPI